MTLWLDFDVKDEVRRTIAIRKINVSQSALSAPLRPLLILETWAYFSRASYHIFNSKCPLHRLRLQALTGELLNAAALTCVVIDKP